MQLSAEIQRKIAHIIKAAGIFLPKPFVSLHGTESLIADGLKIFFQPHKIKVTYVFLLRHSAKIRKGRRRTDD